jgi:hypothetical protein
MSRRVFVRYLIAALITFAVGLCIVLVWSAYRKPVLEEIETPPDCLTDYEKQNTNEQSTQLSYFPPESFAADHDLGQFKAENYPKNLVGMNEPSLLHLPGCVNEIYRFLWLRAFHPPVAVRVWQAGGKWFLVAKQLDEQGKLTVVKLRPLTENEWLAFKDLLNKASFWTLPTVGGTLNGNDGAQWLLEGAKDKQYHLVDRWVPEDENYRAACIFLLKQSGLEIDSSHYERY